MPHTSIQKVTIQNCGCVKKAEVNLTRLHALIGPNDSGKSTILRALRTATQFATGEFTKNDKGELLPFTPLVTEASDGAIIGLALDDEYRLMCEDGALVEVVLHGGATLPPGRKPRPWLGKSLLWNLSHAQQDPLRRLAKLKSELPLSNARALRSGCPSCRRAIASGYRWGSLWRRKGNGTGCRVRCYPEPGSRSHRGDRGSSARTLPDSKEHRAVRPGWADEGREGDAQGREGNRRLRDERGPALFLGVRCASVLRILASSCRGAGERSPSLRSTT